MDLDSDSCQYAGLWVDVYVLIQWVTFSIVAPIIFIMRHLGVKSLQETLEFRSDFKVEPFTDASHWSHVHHSVLLMPSEESSFQTRGYDKHSETIQPSLNFDTLLTLVESGRQQRFG